MLCAAIAICAAIMTYWPQGLFVLRYDRIPILSGELWRLLSGHLVHMNTPHLMLNLLALFLLCELLWRDMPAWQGAGLMTVGSLGVSALLFTFHPELAWYAGLSGALHCLWAGCALLGCLKGDANLKPALYTEVNEPNEASDRDNASRIIAAVAMALLFLKLLLEFYFGPSERTAQAIGGDVIAVAHAYGALLGLAGISGLVLVRRGRPAFQQAGRAVFRLK